MFRDTNGHPKKKRHGVTPANWWYIWYLKIYLGKSREFLRITSSPVPQKEAQKYGKTTLDPLTTGISVSQNPPGASLDAMFQRFTPFPRKKSLFLAWLVTIKGFAHALEGHGKHLHQFLRYLLKEAPSRNHLKSCDLTKSCTGGDDWNTVIHGIRDIDELYLNNMFIWLAELVCKFGGLCPMTWYFGGCLFYRIDL